MKFEEVFNAAVWVGAGEYENAFMGKEEKIPYFPILRSRFELKKAKKVTLKIVGLGFFTAYINGKRVSEDRFLPLSTDYGKRENHPIGEQLFGHRLYVPEFDITHLVEEGNNTLVVHFGGGWYTFCGGWYAPDSKATYTKERFGGAKVVYVIEAEYENGEKQSFYSSEKDKICASFVKTYHFTNFENQDYRGFDSAVFEKEYDESKMQNAVKVKPVDTEYLFSDCPFDRIQSVAEPILLKDENGVKTYDLSEEASYIPVLKIKAKEGEKVNVYFSEELDKNGDFHFGFCHRQSFSVVSDGKTRVVRPEFTWFAFRYVRVEGNAELVAAEKVHADVKVSSTLESDSELLNYIYKIYLNTQLCNMHTGIPTDCPHIERRGYTGDGELTAPAAMATLDAEEFYRKWIEDISDCQDVLSGHVQYTAPYTKCGGGPGAWGCAIVEVPWRFYKEYGDISYCEKMYPQMLAYFEYMESHSDNYLVTRDKENEWCLGDWLPPESVVIPAPFVNNYYYIRSMERVIKIGKLIGRLDEIPMLEKRIKERKDAIVAAYYGSWNGSFIGGLQGANAFAADLKLDEYLNDDRIYAFALSKAKSIGRYDTGICGTDVLTRVLFARGDGETAANLILSEDPVSFYGFMQRGSTTIGESWPNTYWDRSRFHPMFGAVVAYFFEYLLGISQTEESAGYEDLVISPVFVSKINRLSGSRKIPSGEVKVSYEKNDSKVDIKVTLPIGKTAKFVYGEFTKTLESGENVFSIEL